MNEGLKGETSRSNKVVSGKLVSVHHCEAYGERLLVSHDLKDHFLVVLRIQIVADDGSSERLSSQ